MKDTQFAVVKVPKCLEGPHNTYDRSTKSSRMQHRSRSNRRDGHSSTYDTREGSYFWISVQLKKITRKSRNRWSLSGGGVSTYGHLTRR